MLCYVTISILPLFVVWALVGRGYRISRIQQWREKNKHFLQYSAGASLIILGAFTFVHEALGGAL